jgi:hypothetical protein
MSPEVARLRTPVWAERPLCTNSCRYLLRSSTPTKAGALLDRRPALKSLLGDVTLGKATPCL